MTIAQNWGAIIAEAEKKGKPLPLMDNLIAIYGLT